jgi:hypothetical protein
MPRFLRLSLYARAFVTRYPGFLRLRASPCFWRSLYGMIWAGYMMLCFYTTRANFAIPPHPNKAQQNHVHREMQPLQDFRAPGGNVLREMRSFFIGDSGKFFMS